MGLNLPDLLKWLSAAGTGAGTPTPPPILADTITRARVLGVNDVTPSATLRTDDGPVVDGTLAGNVFTFTLTGAVKPHGATIIVRALGYFTTEPRLVLQPNQDRFVPDITLERIPVPKPADPKPDTPPNPTPPGLNVATDAIDLMRAKVAARDCPDVRHWQILAGISSFTLANSERFERGNTMIEFPGRDTLPAAMGTQGAISYTLWMGCRIHALWHVLPIVECIRAYVPTGHLLEPGHIGPNLLYFADPPLQGYQPAPNEEVVFFATTGDTRRQNAQAPGVTPGRTNVIRAPFAVCTLTF